MMPSRHILFQKPDGSRPLPDVLFDIRPEAGLPQFLRDLPDPLLLEIHEDDRLRYDIIRQAEAAAGDTGNRHGLGVAHHEDDGMVLDRKSVV